MLCGSDLLESFTTPGVWIPDQVSFYFTVKFVLLSLRLCASSRITQSCTFQINVVQLAFDFL
jgi:hypothetical protein